MGNFFLHLIIFLPFLILINCNNHSETPSPSLIPDLLNFIDQRLALVYPIIQTFKNTITSDPLGITATWVGGDVCNYKGFYCDHPPDNATATALASIDFNGFLLGAPSIDGFIEKLPDLAVFHANTNFFSGTISPKIAELPYLYELDISNNKFSGVFPVAILNMIRLTFLDIRFNFFIGSVPPQIFTKTLDALFVNNNNFLQNLPENLGSTPAVYLTLANNKFTGPIPRSIGKASNTLAEVLFLNNLLTGCLPHEIGFLRQAIVFDAGNNLLTGPLPCSLGCLEKIEQLSFAGNLMYGQVPEVVCSLRNLENLTLSDNYFTQIGPVCRKLVKSGVLDVRKNCIQDLPGQRSIEECALFFLHPRTCQFPETFKIMPCKVSTTSHRSPRSSKRLPVSYAALSRHKLR